MRWLRQLSFGSKLLTTFIVIIAFTTLAGYFFISLSVNRAFSEFSTGRYLNEDRRLFAIFGLLYSQAGNMDNLFASLVERSINLPAVIVNSDGVVAFSPDLSQVQVGRRLNDDLIDLGQEFAADGQQWTYLPSRFLVGLQWEDAYLRRARRSLWFAGLSAGIAAILLSFFIIRQLVGPVRKLDAASRRIAEGNFEDRVSIPSTDELGRLADSFNEMAASLHEAEQVKRRLIADISHELRTPITAVRTTLEGLRDGLIEPSQETLTALHDKLLLTSRLVQDLHQLALADTGRLSIRLAPFSIHQTLETIFETIGVQLDDERIHLTQALADDLPTILADAQRIEQVLLNLLANAIRHTPPGGTLRVRTELLNDVIRVSICDSGPGLSAADLRHVFDRFYRAEDARSVDSGTGLGLSIAKALIEAHGGNISASNVDDGGACFAFTLPLQGPTTES